MIAFNGGLRACTCVPVCACVNMRLCELLSLWEPEGEPTSLWVSVYETSLHERRFYPTRKSLGSAGGQPGGAGRGRGEGDAKVPRAQGPLPPLGRGPTASLRVPSTTPLPCAVTSQRLFPHPKSRDHNKSLLIEFGEER